LLCKNLSVYLITQQVYSLSDKSFTLLDQHTDGWKGLYFFENSVVYALSNRTWAIYDFNLNSTHYFYDETTDGTIFPRKVFRDENNFLMKIFPSGNFKLFNLDNLNTTILFTSQHLDPVSFSKGKILLTFFEESSGSSMQRIRIYNLSDGLFNDLQLEPFECSGSQCRFPFLNLEKDILFWNYETSEDQSAYLFDLNSEIKREFLLNNGSFFGSSNFDGDFISLFGMHGLNRFFGLFDFNENETYDLTLGSNVHLSTHYPLYSRINFNGNSGVYLLPSIRNISQRGYLTIFSSPNTIPSKAFFNLQGSYSTFCALDSNIYGDFKDNSYETDVFVGRIQGISISDVSGYVSRDLFYSELEQGGISFLVGNGQDDHNSALDYIGSILIPNWMNIFDSSLFDVDCLVKESFIGSCLEYSKKSFEWKISMQEKESIYLAHHGSSHSAGIDSSEIPFLSSGFFSAESCLTCSTYAGNSFCNHVIRKGSLSYLGAISPTNPNPIYSKPLEEIYKNNLDLGESFAKYQDVSSCMALLIGDPTLKLNPDYILEEELAW
jgi:hypothetical protein